MSTIMQTVQGFLREMEWNWEQLGEHRLRAIVDGRNFRWLWFPSWPEDESIFISYVTCPFQIPELRRAAVAEYFTLANYGLPVGNFELDFSDGEVRFKASLPLRKTRLNRGLVRDLAFCGFSCMDHYVPAMMTVAFGEVTPRNAIETADPPTRPAPAEDEPADDDEDDAVERVERATRVAQMVEHLRRMKDRTLNEAKSHCLLVLSSAYSAKRKLRNVRQFRCKDELPHVVQVCFHDDWFAIDIPNTSILPREAEKLLAERSGFYREAEKPDADVSDVSQIVEFDPVGKRYTYGQEQEAAEDAAWIFFDLWGVDPSQPFYVSASSVKTDHRWEQDELLK